MEENKKLQIDAFLKKQIREMPLASPSKDFTRNLMETLLREEYKATQYTPLISGKVWLSILTFIILFAGFLFFIPLQKEESSLLGKIPVDFSFLTEISFSELFSGFSISNITSYGLLLFFVMMSIQTFYLKGYFSKRFSNL
ncbi:MAG: hypothetical protein GKR88_05270 [Flavobacteriaceae bacterium]|nr:MAG: hypothetical protein GKR88_05270 [Flavobacteriaceae bacterium]